MKIPKKSVMLSPIGLMVSDSRFSAERQGFESPIGYTRWTGEYIVIWKAGLFLCKKLVDKLAIKWYYFFSS